MNTTTACIMKTRHCKPAGGIARLKSWAILVAVILATFLFLTVLGPMGLQTKALKPMADFIEEHNIDANAYYYTEVEEFFKAERHMRDHLELVPGSRR